MIMNKNYTFQLFSAILILFPILSFAQSPILTNQMISPIAGESYTFNHIDTTYIGSAGENQVWDFSEVTSDSDDPLNYITTEQTMHAQYFPGANVSSADQNMCMFEFYQKSATRLTYVGIYMDGLIMYFDDYKDALHYPFEYGDTLFDTFSTLYEQSTAMHHRIGTIHAEADAYGTLILPWGTLENVLRVKTIEEMTDTFTFNTTPYEYDYYYETYAYYKPGIREPVLEFMYSSINDSDPVLSGHYISEAEVNSIKKFDRGTMKLYPNPVKNQLNMETITTNPIQYCSITDLDGKLIWEDNESLFIGKKTMDVDFLKPGFYLVKVIAGDEYIIRKFVKE